MFQASTSAGSHFRANASKFKNVSYERAGELVEQFDPESTAPWEEALRLVRESKDPDTHDVLQFTYPAETVAVSSALRDYARESFTPGTPLLKAAAHLMTRIFKEFAYDPNVITVTTPMEEILEKCRGVCQDFAHLQIGGLARSGCPRAT